jgi:hypothetical protein
MKSLHKKIISEKLTKLGTEGKGYIAAAAMAACLLPAAGAQAGGTISFGEDKSVSVGFGLRSSFTSAEGGALDGSRSADFNINSTRLYLGASLNKYIKGTFNVDNDGSGNIVLLDGYAQFELADEFNIWVGRMLPPGDRANMDGPYYLNTWSYPMVSQFVSKFAGRDDGVTVWGKLLDKKLVYAVGAFMGHNRFPGASNQSSSILVSYRVAFNFLDPEPNPAYYESSTYYGSVDVLTLAVAGMHQSNGVGTAALPGDYNAFSVDLLFEKKLGDAGVLTLEGAFYDYATNDVFDYVPPPGVSLTPNNNTGGVTNGQGYLGSVAYLLPAKVGWGMFQPYGRYQQFEADLLGGKAKKYDVGVNYVIDGHNARVSLEYATTKVTATPSTDAVVLGLQLQF